MPGTRDRWVKGRVPALKALAGGEVRLARDISGSDDEWPVVMLWSLDFICDKREPLRNVPGVSGT